MVSVVLFRGFCLLSWITLSSPMRILHLWRDLIGALSHRGITFLEERECWIFGKKKKERLTYGRRLWGLPSDR